MLVENFASGLLFGVVLSAIFAASTAGGRSYAWNGSDWDTWLLSVNRLESMRMHFRYFICACIITISAFLFAVIGA